MAKRVLLTGSGGFIGAHCLEYFLDNTDWEIICVDSFRNKGTISRHREATRNHPDYQKRVKTYTHDLSVPIDHQLENLILDRKIDDRGNIVSKKLDYIINMASDLAVERSTLDPTYCLRNNFDLAVNMLEFARRVNPTIFFHVSTDEVYGEAKPDQAHVEWDVIMPSNPYAASKAAQEAVVIAYWRTYDVPVVITNCYSMDTKIVTIDGFKGYDEIQEGDLVWTLDENENLIQEPVLEKVRMPYAGDMIHFESNKIDQLVTPNHRMMIKRSVGDPRRWSEIKCVLAEELIDLKGRIRIPTCGDWEGDDRSEIPTSELIDQDSLHLLAKKLPDTLCTEWLANMAGWFVSEGYIGSGVNFGGASQKQKFELCKIFEHVGLHHREGHNGRYITGCSKALESLCGQFGHLAQNKKLPQWVLNMSPRLLEIFWEAAMAGDGSKIKTNSGGTGLVYYTSSWTLAQQMCEVGMKLGMATRICERETWNPSKTQKSQSYIVRFRRREADIEKRNIMTVQNEDGEVWCIRVPSGRVFIERNGKVSLSGQTMNNIGEWQDPEKFLPKIIQTVSTNGTVPIYGDSEDSIGSRFYLHAKNHADAFVFLSKFAPARYSEGAERPDRYNVCGDVELNNLEMAQLVAELMDKPLNYKLIPSESARKGYDRRYALDGAKLKDKGWTPPVPFKDSLKQVVDWTLANPHWLV